MSYQTNVAVHNTKVRVLLFFMRPFHIFNVILFVKMWKLLSYGPSTFPKYFGNDSAVQVTQWLWREEFSSFIWYFLLVAIVDLAIQEFLPVIRND